MPRRRTRLLPLGESPDRSPCRDQFFDFPEVPLPQMSETTMPSVVREGLWRLSRLVWFGPTVLSACSSTSSLAVWRGRSLPWGTVFATIVPPTRIFVPLVGCMLISSPFPSRTLLESRLESIPGTCSTSSRVTYTHVPSWPATVIRTLLAPMPWSFPFAVLTDSSLIKMCLCGVKCSEAPESRIQ